MSITENGKATAAPAPTEQLATFKLTRLQRETFAIPIRGTAPLIVNRWSEKAKQTMLGNMGPATARAKKERKDPIAEFEASRYRLDDGRDGVPAVSFKAAITHGTRLFDGLTIVLMKTVISVIGEGNEQLVPIQFDSMRMREDPVRVGKGGTDLRYRAEYWPWRAELLVRTIAGQFDRDSLMSLVDAAGVGGICEWRPSAPKSATGTYGTFEIVDSDGAAR